MIRELRIKNLALIEDVLVEFDKGFSVFTGETGAGKSILVGAIGLLLGERASSEHIRSGCEEAEVCGVFELATVQKQLADIFAANAISNEDGTCIVRRVINKSGKNRVFINQVPVPLSVLKSVGDQLIDFHGQHEHQSLLDESNALLILDRLPGIAHELDIYTKTFIEYSHVKEELDGHDKRCAALAEKRDVIDFQYKELKSLDLKPDEEIKLEEELTLLSSTAQRLECVSVINDLITADDASVGHLTGLIKKNLENLARFDATAFPWITEIENTSRVFAELEAYCEKYLESSQPSGDTSTIDDINARLSKIQRLKKKYSCDYNGLLEKQLQLKADLDALVNTEADRSQLEKKVLAALKKCKEVGAVLSANRRKQALQFDKAITLEMAKLGFNGGAWETEFVPHSEPTGIGFENIMFLVRTNRGEPLLPLVKIASGGEISRLMLAIKTIMAAHDHIPILIFDEIDTGIGGVLAKEVATAMELLGKTHQLLCISHLHQIASKANHHYFVFKETQGKRTITQVKKLSQEQRTDEIARMLGGDSAIARKHAEELLGR
jgi:DNA repair protein RecN (Recombination protein N)